MRGRRRFARPQRGYPGSTQTPSHASCESTHGPDESVRHIRPYRQGGSCLLGHRKGESTHPVPLGESIRQRISSEVSTMKAGEHPMCTACWRIRPTKYAACSGYCKAFDVYQTGVNESNLSRIRSLLGVGR